MTYTSHYVAEGAEAARPLGMGEQDCNKEAQNRPQGLAGVGAGTIMFDNAMNNAVMPCTDHAGPAADLLLTCVR